MVKEQITRNKAELIVQLAMETGALIKQEEFKFFDRALILTPDGIVAIRSGKNEDKQECEATEFHGLDKDMNDIRAKFLQIKINGLFN